MESGYKVCKEVNSSYYSASAEDTGKVSYSIREETTPAENCGPLTVFDTLDHAKEWILALISDTTKDTGLYSIFKCEYESSNSKYVFTNSTESNRASRTTHISKLPSGAVLATSITLTRKIRWP